MRQSLQAKCATFLWEMLDQFIGLSKHYGIDCLGTASTYNKELGKMQTWLTAKEKERK